MPSPPDKIRILIVDDHPLLREGVAALIAKTPDLEVCGEAASAGEAVKQHAALRPDVTVMDLQMPGPCGIEAIAAIRRAAPAARVVVLTSYGGDALAARAMRAGAAAFVLKEVARKELLGTLRAVHRGDDLPKAVARHRAPEPMADNPLSHREREVIELMADGNSNKVIARALDISEETVKTHLTNIRQKLGANDRAHIVALATEFKEIGPGPDAAGGCAMSD